jgi:hypothetical protein
VGLGMGYLELPQVRDTILERVAFISFSDFQHLT